MSVIRSLPDSAYGTGIGRVVSDMTGKEVSDAQIFVALRRLERQGFIASSPGQNPVPSKKTRGRPRVYYELTATGLRALEAADAITSFVLADQRSVKERKNGRQSQGPKLTSVVG